MFIAFFELARALALLLNSEIRNSSFIRTSTPAGARTPPSNSPLRNCFDFLHSSLGFVRILLLLFLLAGAQNPAYARELPLPPRPVAAPTASQLLPQIAALDLPARETRLASEILAGNVPNFLRMLRPVHSTNVVSGITNELTFFVTPDYLTVGSDSDYFLAPLSPHTAQRIADVLNCSLPTPKMVDLIYRQAQVKLAPAPIAPSDAMTTIAVFSNHNFIVSQQRRAFLREHPLGELVAGHQKDVVISARLTNSIGKVAIYGWHRTNGVPIQPLYLGHTSLWVDYSQCIRLVQQAAILNGQPAKITDILADTNLTSLISDEGPLRVIRYPTNFPSSSSTSTTAAADAPVHSVARTPNNSIPAEGFSGFQRSNAFGEEIASFSIQPEVKVQINREALPGRSGGGAPTSTVQSQTNTLLIFYALPNGNTIAQTAGHRIKPQEDWHFDIQHIAAQTRFLRRLQPPRNITVIYLESAQKSWPAWRKAHGDNLLPKILAEIQKLCTPTNESNTEIVLSSHSGGGSLIFGYLNTLDKIPDDIVRIAFLDSDYGYDAALRHDQKIADWLRANKPHYLCVLAYDDANALLDGKPFVSSAGGTWGRSHAMARDLSKIFKFNSSTNSGLENFSALNGRIQFLLKQNPERKILHTVQVERNGFIQSVLSGTALESKTYEYLGERAYSELIEAE